jgi:Tetratricopeptide repeat
VRTDKKIPPKSDKKTPSRVHKQGVIGYSKKSALLEEVITSMNTGKYGRSSTVLKELLALDPENVEARRLFATLHLRLGSLVAARQAFESLANDAIERQDFWLAESLLREYLAAGPRCVPFLERLAHVYEEKGDTVAAVAELGKAISILIEDADSENPTKPSQLYAKVRELAPASAVACQLASLFDIQTGELLAVHPRASAAVTSLEAVPLQPEDEALAASEASTMMPWEQFDEAPPSHEAPERTLSNPVIDSLDSSNIPIEPAPVGLAQQGQEVPLVEHTSVEEGHIPSLSEEPISDVGGTIASSVDSPGLSSPMPWEQIEHTSIKIEDPTPLTSPSGQSAEVSQSGGESVMVPPAAIQLESVSDQLLSPTPIPDPTEPRESIFAAEPSTVPTALQEPEVLTPPAADSSPEAPFSWNTVFDGPWKFDAGNSSSSSSAALSELGTSQQDVTELESAQPEPSPSAGPSLSSEVSGSIEDTVTSRASDLAQPTPGLASEEPFRLAQPTTYSSNIPSSFNLAPSAPFLSEPIEPPHESEPGLSLSLTEPIPLASSDGSSVSVASTEAQSNWSTGEVEVQSHRPSEKKRNWDKEKGEAPVVPPSVSPVVESSEAVTELSRSGGWESAPSLAVAPIVEAAAPVPEPVVMKEDTRPDWVLASESVTFVNPLPPSPIAWRDPGIEASLSQSEPVVSVAASAVDVLFDAEGEKPQASGHDRVASPKPPSGLAVRASRVSIGLSSFIGSCFSTTRSIVLLCVGLAFASLMSAAVGIGAVIVAWIAMEAPPSPVYHNLTASPPSVLTDSRKNGYYFLLGFDASEEQDPLQAGYGRRVEGSDLPAANSCMLGDEGKGMGTTDASANVTRGWFTSPDPVGQLKPHAAAVQSWAAQESVALRRYQQWLSMPFEDAGYGQILSPNCAHILAAHRLYLAEGFAQDLNTGLERLQTDMASWRVALGQSKTLMVKMLAATAVQDSIAIASGLLSQHDLDGATISQLSKIVRPLDQVELSLRWPMQSHLLWATKSATTNLKNHKADDRPLYVTLAAAMPLPVQRRSNAYADYYEAASKAVAEGRYTSLPKLSSFIRTPAVGVMDYVANPIENIIGVEPLPSWDPYVGRMVEIDAQLRLASLQVWVRRGTQEENVLTRLAKAGQSHYDPFTGLPMLVNQKKGVMYSVGRDGRDQEGDTMRDVVAIIPKL